MVFLYEQTNILEWPRRPYIGSEADSKRMAYAVGLMEAEPEPMKYVILSSSEAHFLSYVHFGISPMSCIPRNISLGFLK